MPNPNRLITSTENFPIKPSDIDTTPRSFGDSLWRHSECEYAAMDIVRLMQKKGDWVSFTLVEIQVEHEEGEFRRHGTLVLAPGQGSPFSFDELVGKDKKAKEGVVHSRGGPSYYVSSDIFVALQSGRYYVTDAFVWYCYQASPVVKPKLA